jgi:hypothetical protein
VPRRSQPIISVPREELPRTLFPGSPVPLRRYNEHELAALASRPQTIVPLPDNVTGTMRTRMANLAQYRGRSAEGNKASLGNLPRKRSTMSETNDQPPQMPPGVTAPVVPTAFPRVPVQKTLQGKMARRALSREEYDLFLETYANWMTAHPEYDNIEDKDDVSTIAMETVLMLRMQMLQMQKPTTDITEPYNQSFRRKQQARENLQASREARLSKKKGGGGGNTIINVAVASGNITPQMVEERRNRIKLDEDREMRFLQGTIVSAETLAVSEKE